MSTSRFLNRFLEWSADRSDIRAVVILGSHARKDHPADEWSDLDVVIVATQPALYLSTPRWLENLGPPRISFLERTGLGGQMERRVLFDDGLDVDFAIISTKTIRKLVWFLWARKHFPFLLRLLPASVVGEGTRGLDVFREVARKGMQILFDKDRLIKKLVSMVDRMQPWGPPSEEEFGERVNDFWYHAVWTVRKLRRGEIWTAKTCSDVYMKRILLEIVELHAKVMHGPGYETWHEGRFLEEWADQRVVRALGNCFAHYDEKDVARALVATMELFRWITKAIAEKLGYQYPSKADETASGIVARNLDPVLAK